MILNTIIALIIALITVPNYDVNKSAAVLNKQPDAQQQDLIDYEKIDYEKLNRSIFYATNQARAELQLPPLKYSKALEKAAFEHSISMAEKGYLSHTGREAGSRTMTDRLTRVGVPSAFMGENIATTFGGNNSSFNHFHKRSQPIPPKAYSYQEVAENVVNQWMASPGHQANILHTTYHYLGCGAMLRPFTDVDETPIFLATQCFSSNESNKSTSELRIDYQTPSIKSSESYKSVFQP